MSSKMRMPYLTLFGSVYFVQGAVLTYFSTFNTIYLRTFNLSYEGAPDIDTDLPLEWCDSHLYRGWNLAWLAGRGPAALSVIERFDPLTLQFILRG